MKKLFLACLCIILITACGSEKKEGAKTPPVNKRPRVVMETELGNIVLELYGDVAPNHVRNFIDLANTGFYDSLTFHRVLKGTMIQGGDPAGDGTGNSGFVIPSEFSNLQHLPGTLAMARGHDPNSASCQFYICLSQLPELDNKYTIFGQVVEGMDVARKIGAAETEKSSVMGGEKSKPVIPIRMLKVREEALKPEEAGTG